MKLDIIENILTKNDCYKKGDTIKPIGMQLHTIGTAQNTSSALASYWNQSSVEACVHYCVDAETEGLVRHFLPDNRRSWSDGGFGNGNLITVELMESDYMKYTGGANYNITNSAKFKADVTRAYNTAVYFFAYKCKEYGWNPLDKLSNGLYRISSHDEGRRLGVSTAHVDPTHIWNIYGWTMDQFRKDVKKVMDGGEIDVNTSASTVTTYYRVRKSWNDPDSQLGAYEVLQNAKDNCPEGYSVFNEKGKSVYAHKATTSTVTSGNTDKVWMGWTKRETGKDGLRCVFGDAGKAYGLQFDYRYGLVPFMQYCVKYNPTRYSGFNAYIALGAGNSALINNQGLGKLWQKYYDSYTNEFEQLQYTCAYQQYYLPSRNYILSHYGFDIGNCHPAVKGTLWSMSFRSGTETAAKKFYACKGKSDEAILNTVYPTYGSNDAGRWTKAGQWGDALNALKNNTYSLVNVSMTGSTSSSTLSQPTTPKTPYRVATAYTGGKYVGQVGAYDVLDNAQKMANEASQGAQKAYYVYDNTGVVVYTAKPSQTGKITKVSEWINVLKQWEQKMIDVKAVYNNSGNKTDYTVALKQSPVTTNCALFVTHALQVAGLFGKADKFYGASDGSLKGTGATKLTKDIGKIICEYTDKKMKTDKLNLIPGDIVTYYGQHTNVYLGKDSSGKKLWCDAGRGTNIGCKTGASWKSFRRTGEISGMYVSKVIRLNLTDDTGTTVTPSKPATSTFEKYSVRVTIDDLRIRETPNGTIKGYIKPGVYTIVGEKTVGGVKWGQLLSGEGFIALQYTTKC